MNNPRYNRLLFFHDIVYHYMKISLKKSNIFLPPPPPTLFAFDEEVDRTVFSATPFFIPNKILNFSAILSSRNAAFFRWLYVCVDTTSAYNFSFFGMYIYFLPPTSPPQTAVEQHPPNLSAPHSTIDDTKRRCGGEQDPGMGMMAEE